MDWNFSISWFLIGLLIFGAGGAVTAFYRQISDSIVDGVSSYDRVKFWGIVITIVGFTVMTNLHTLILTAFINLVFAR